MSDPNNSSQPAPTPSGSGTNLPNPLPVMSLKEIQLALLSIQLPQQLQTSLIRLCLDVETRIEQDQKNQFSQRTLALLCASLMVDGSEDEQVLSGAAKVHIDHKTMTAVTEHFKEHGIPMVHYEENEDKDGFVSLQYER